jgi:hypothetical protein
MGVIMGVLGEGRTRALLSSKVEHKMERVVTLVYSVVSLQEDDASTREQTLIVANLVATVGNFNTVAIITRIEFRSTRWYTGLFFFFVLFVCKNIFSSSCLACTL